MSNWKSLGVRFGGSFLSLREVVGPGYRVTFEIDKGHGRGYAFTEPTPKCGRGHLL